MRTPLLCLLLAGCTPRGDWADIPITSASLVDLDTHAAAVIAGPVGGDALLVYDGPEGGGVVPVSLRGGRLGAVVDISLDLNPGSDVHLDLTEADPDLRLPDLFVAYNGTSASLTTGFGVGGRTLKSRHGVKLSDVHFTAGVGVYGGFEWLRLREGGDEDTSDDSVWNPVDTADTADTGAEPDPPPQTELDCGGCQEPTGADCDDGCSASGSPRLGPLLLLALGVLVRRRVSDRGTGPSSSR